MLVKELTNIQGGTPIEGLCNWRIGGQYTVGSGQSSVGKGLGARGLSGDRICWAVYSRQSAVFSRQSSVGSFQSAVGNRQGASLSAAEIPPREGSWQSAVGSHQSEVISKR